MREAFKVRGAKYFIIDSHGKAHWSQVPSSVTGCMSLDKSKLVELTEYLIDTVFVKAGNICIGRISVSTWEQTVHHSWVNLYLFHHEYSHTLHNIFCVHIFLSC